MYRHSSGWRHTRTPALNPTPRQVRESQIYAMTYNPPARHNSATKIHDRPRASAPQFLLVAYFFSLALSAMAWVALPPVRRPVRRAAMRPTCARLTPHSRQHLFNNLRPTHQPPRSQSLHQRQPATDPTRSGAGAALQLGQIKRPQGPPDTPTRGPASCACHSNQERSSARQHAHSSVSHPTPGTSSDPSRLDSIPTRQHITLLRGALPPHDNAAIAVPHRRPAKAPIKQPRPASREQHAPQTRLWGGRAGESGTLRPCALSRRTVAGLPICWWLPPPKGCSTGFIHTPRTTGHSFLLPFCRHTRERQHAALTWTVARRHNAEKGWRS